MTNKEKFLIQNVGFHFEDLSLMRQAELEVIMNEMGVSQNWILIALSKDKLENWEKWGFNLFKKPDFKNNIDGILKAFDKMEDAKFQKELRKGKQKKEIYISQENFKNIYTSVMKQGRLYSHAEADKQGLDKYWTYGNGLTNDGKLWINLLLAEHKNWDQIDEDDWVRFATAVVYTATVAR